MAYTTIDGRTYPLRILFWYRVHDLAERFWHWVYRAKLKPWIDSQHGTPIEPTYHLIETIPATPEEQAAGLTERRIYWASR